MSGSSGPSTSQTTSNTVPTWLQPFFTNELNNAQNLNTTGQSGTTAAPVAPLSQLQNQGIASAAAVNPTSIGAANSALTGILNGNNLSPSSNPYLQQTAQTAENQSQNQIASEFAGNGRNVTASMPVQADANAQITNSIYGGNYANAQNQITAAAGLAPSVTTGQYAPSSALMSAGQTQQTTAQNQLNAPYNTLSWYSSLLGQGASPFSVQGSNAQTSPGTLGTTSSIIGDLGQLI